MSPVRALLVAATGFSIAATCFAQYAISAHSGLVQLTMGSVYLKDEPIHKTVTNLIAVGNGEVLRTGGDGLAEVLLTPGVFLRLGHDASLRMDSNSLTDTRMTVISGSAIVEADDLLPDNELSFQVGDEPVKVVKKGLYRLDGNPAVVATLQGELFVGGNINEVVKKGKDLRMDGSDTELASYHADKKEDLYAFSKARSEDSAYATGVTSSSLYQSGFGAAAGCNSSWYFMGGVGMYSYLPCGGIMNSPFGYGFYGLNSAYLWDGPGYYVPPYALLSGYGSGYYAPGYVSGGGTTRAAGFGSGTMPRVPVFSGPNGATSMPARTALGRSTVASASSATSSMRSVSSSAGASVGHVSAVSSGGRSSGYSGGTSGGFSGGSMPSSAGSSASSASMPSRSGGSSMGSRGAASGGHR
jgi:hypothetical protein